MATRVIDDSKLNNIAVAIQAKDNGGQMTVDEMPGRIANIPAGSTLIPKTITQNGVYNASSDNADGYDVVTVDVQIDPNENFDKFMNNTLEHYSTTATKIPIRCFESKTNMLSINMPNVTDIETYAFTGCTSLSLTSLPSSITHINDYVFMRCTNLALTSLPSGVTNIGTYAFCKCTNLALTSLPSSVTNIGNLAFENCISIPYLDFSNFANIPTVGVNSFRGTTFPFYFRDQQQLDEWAAATNWSTYASRFQIKPNEVI